MKIKKYIYELLVILALAVVAFAIAIGFSTCQAAFGAGIQNG
jgi:hypothetical protein